MKIIILILIILGLTYIAALKITILQNQGGKNKAIFLIIMVAISIVFNYLIFLPLICLLKTKVIITYGPFHPRKFSCSFKYFIFLLLITEVDRAIFKELKECIKNNKAENHDNLNTSFFGFEDETTADDSNKDDKDNKSKKGGDSKCLEEDVKSKYSKMNKKSNVEIITLPINKNIPNIEDVNYASSKYVISNSHSAKNLANRASNKQIINYEEINKRDKENQKNNQNKLEFDDNQNYKYIEKDENDRKKRKENSRIFVNDIIKEDNNDFQINNNEKNKFNNTNNDDENEINFVTRNEKSSKSRK